MEDEEGEQKLIFRFSTVSQSQVSSPTRSAQKPSASGSCRMGPCLLCSHLSSSFHLCQGGALCLHKPRDGKLTCYQGHLCYRTVLIMRLRFLQLNWGLSPGTPPLSLLNTTMASLGSQNICTLCLIHLFIQYIFFPSKSLRFPKHFFIQQMRVISATLQVFMGANETGKAELC